jgi:photosystem II stability/assembly factor-like uncharacterized protein
VAEHAGPRPIENLLDDDAEQRNRIERERWIESLHRAAPGTNWREIEQANREEQILRRAAGGYSSTPATWTEIGSKNQTGRTWQTALATDGVTLYIGTAGGGLWRGTVGGATWTPMSDNLGYGVNKFLVVPGSPQVIVCATNEGSIHVSTDGGATWSVPGGLPDGGVWRCVRLLRDLGSPRTVYLLVEGWKWLGTDWEHDYQLCRSDDGGLAFAIVHTEPLSTQPDIWISRTAAGPLYLMAGGVLKKSLNRGTTFTTVGSVPVASTRDVLVGSEAGAPTFYAAVDSAGRWALYRSTNGGTTWSFRYDLSDFWETLCASISNANLLLIGGVNAYRLTQVGAPVAINDWTQYYGDPTHKLHADIPGIDCIRVGTQESFYINTDGGTYVSTDGGLTVFNITQTGFRDSQYYGTLTSVNNTYLVAAGAQDQGYQQSRPEQGTPLLNFDQLISGDYGHLTSSNGTHNMLYSVYPGSILLQVSENAPQNLQTIAFPPAAQYDWMPYILADPANANRLYFCADHLWRLDKGVGYTYTNTQLPQDFTSGIGDHLTAFGISRADTRYWYATTNSGRMWYSHDAGATWTLSATNGPEAHFFYGTALLPSPTDRNVCYAGGAGYSGPAVYRTTDGGVTWSAMGAGLPSTLVYGLAFDTAAQQTLYAAAESGPYRYNAGTGQWESIIAGGAPLSIYWSVESVPALSSVRFGTYGRGAWDYSYGITGVPQSNETPAAAHPVRVSVTPGVVRDRATIGVTSARSGHVTIEVFDVAGRRLAVLADGAFEDGTMQVRWDLHATSGRPVGSGLYLVRAVTAGGVDVAQFRVVR